MEDRDRPSFDQSLGGPGAEDVVLEDRHGSGVLHRSRIELGDEELVVLLEWVGDPEFSFEELETGLRDPEQLLRIEVLEQ